ncbi:MAG: ABC transporter substrate-binding protein [Clostridia bacterium]|nr:ABC transporter substrate-binding protein [Clostridia bacterium]
MKKFVSLAMALLMLISMIPFASAETVTYTQAPYWDGKDLPAVADRLPTEPMVENAAYLTIGTYGGELKTSTSTSSWTAGKIIEEGLFRFTTEGVAEPNVAKGYTVNEDSTVYTIYLREGMKWSDGQPFTAEDCVWFYNAICLNKVDSKGVRACHKDADGNPAVVEKVDDYTFTVTFGTPKYGFIEALCVDLKWHYAPKHIFEGMVDDIIAGNNDAALAKAKEICGVEFADVSKAGKEMLYYFWNYPGIPTLNPYVLSTEAGKNDVKGDYYEYVRNPYYWKVDAQGQQLPYIDKITYTAIQNVDQSLMLLLDGTVDFQTVGMDSLATIMSDAQVKININEWSSGSWGNTQTQLHMNMSIADEKLNALFNNADFRQAVSIAVDRTEFAGLFSDGWLEGGQAAPSQGALGYSEEWASKWTEYDTAKAKTLLESAGLVMGADGYYDFADGTDFALNIVSVADSGAADTYALLKPYYDAAGIKTTFRDYDRSNIDNMILANEIECILFPVTGLGDISIVLKPNSFIPGTATNVVWYGTMTKENATGDLLKLIELKEQLDVTADTDARTEIAKQMLKLHEENMWVIAYVASAPTYHAVNARIQNFPSTGVWSDIYRDLGIAHVQCWYIQE